ncbi:MAG: tyrosine-type recombinase/integrase [Porticoccaceae bacterium]|jgi:integrase
MTNRTEKLTKAIVTNEPLATDGRQFIIWDTEIKGFGLRVSRTTKSYIFFGRVAGKQKTITIGRASDLSTLDARDKARALAVEMRGGGDPNERKARDAVMDITLRESLDDYLSTHTKLKERTRKEYAYILNAKLADWMDKPINTITPMMVKKRYQQITEQAKTQGDLAFRVARIVINNALGLMEDAGATPPPNPCRVLSRSKMWRGVVRKQTVIPPERLPDWWHAASNAAHNDRAVAELFVFLLLTGTRKSEALNLAWRDVDLNRRTLLFRDTKNGKDHTLPIADHLLGILTERRKDRGTRAYVFETDRGRVSNLRYFQDDVNEATGLWITPHDLRRTFLSIGADFLPELVLKRLVNHVNSANVTEGYIIKAVDDLRDPMQRLENRILQLAGVLDPVAQVIDINARRNAG